MSPRLTYPRVVSEKHPLADGSRVARSLTIPPYTPDDLDREIVKEILAIHRDMPPMSPATGEWKWINQHRRQTYLQALERGDVDWLMNKFANMFRNEVTFGIMNSHIESLHTIDDYTQLESAILLDLDVWREFTEQDGTAMQILQAPPVGNPYGVLEGNLLIAVDTPRHDYFALKLERLSKELTVPRPVILEIGGGYGGLGLQILRRISNVQFMNCDLPEGLYVSYYFLRKSTSRKIVWATGKDLSAIREADVILIPSHNDQAITGPVDIVINCNSLSEMGKSTLEHYMARLRQWAPSYFLHQNSNFLLFPESERHIEILASDFPIDRTLYKEIYRAVSPWQGAGGRYREFLYQKIGPSPLPERPR